MIYNLLLLFPLTYVVVSLTRYVIRSTKGPSRYPPGPKPWPIIGNILDVPSTKAWEVYSTWSRSYGEDLVHFTVLDQHMVVVNSRELAHQLFDKRSAIYSDRPHVPMIELIGWADNGFAFMPYSKTWQQHRRLFQEGFRNTTVDHVPILTQTTRQFLINLLEHPNEFRAHIQVLTSAIILGIVYGQDIRCADDPLVELAEEGTETLVTLGTLSAAIVNLFPFMRHFPAWVPGCSFQQIAREAHQSVNSMVEKPYSLVADQMKSGVQKPSVLAGYLDRYRASRDNGDNNGLDIQTIKQVCAMAYAGGAESTRSSLATFFLAMATHPHVQKKAQEDIDNLLGENCLPTLRDRPKLHYIEAIMRECFRWRPITPLGFPHSTLSDDMINGYHIPKGTSVFANIWAMTRDATRYPDPENFDPERFLTEDGSCNDDDMFFTFGFGRRICPGRYLATNTTWLTIAYVLAVFNISKAKDEVGNDIELSDVDYIEGLALHPKPFPCIITPRTDRARVFISELAD